MNDLNLRKAHSPDESTLNQRFTIFSSKIISIATLIKSPDNIMPQFTHRHPEYEFLLPHTPIPSLLNEGRPYFGEVGWVYPVESMHSHGLKYDLADVSHTNIIISKEYMDNLIEKLGKKGYKFDYEFIISEDTRLYLNELCSEFSKDETKCDIKIFHLTALLTISLIESGLCGLDSSKDQSKYYKGIREITDYINAHYDENLSIADMACSLNISKYYFIKIFKQATGESPMVYINKLRISKAKYLLKTDNLPISEIANVCGFRQASSFASQFKRYCGVSPSEYKKTERFL